MADAGPPDCQGYRAVPIADVGPADCQGHRAVPIADVGPSDCLGHWQFRSSMLDPQIAKAVEQFRSPMLDPQIAKAIEQFRSSMLDPQIAKAIEQFGAVLQDSPIGKLIEQSRSALANTRLGKQFQNSYSQVGSALAGASVAALLEELESRRADFSGESGSEAEPPPRRIDAEGHATVSVTVTGDGRVEKSKTQDTQPKTQDLSYIPTWFIRLVLHLLLHSIQLDHWEQIRESVVDLNARAPKTESFYELRNFIRTKLSRKPGDVRLITGSNVNLRLDPGMKSEIIIALPKNSIVVVQGKEDRTWLLVSYELEGYWINGYVSTKYLKKV